MTLTTMASSTLSSDFRQTRPFPFTINPLYGPVPPPTLGFQTITSFEPKRYTSARVTPQALTNSSVLSLRQHMDESNHDMVNLLTHQI
ncbi:hypothetical protein A2U01_0060195, partial [Trifolium medium]|nr:hypothetical protein [Trifolium medium]